MSPNEKDVDNLIGQFNKLSDRAKSMFVRKLLGGLVKPLQGDKLIARLDFFITILAENMQDRQVTEFLAHLVEKIDIIVASTDRATDELN